MIAPAARDGISRSTLLCLVFGVFLAPDASPLLDRATLGRVLAWAGTQPAGALALQDAPVPSSLRDRVFEQLPDRLRRMETAIGTWAETGVWVVGHDDPEFPRRLRRRMGVETPVLLFGTGDRVLFGRGGVALAQGGDADDGFPALHDALARAGMSLIGCSGDAIRIRREAPHAVAGLQLAAPGIAHESASGEQQALRNCCHALADAVVVSNVRRGDPAWATVVATITRDQQPVWVRNTGEDAALLIRAGARPLPPDLLREDATALLRPAPSPQGRRLLHGTTMRDPRTGPKQMGGPVLVRGFAETQSGFGAQEDGSAVRAPFLRLVDADNTSPRRATPVANSSPAAGPTLFELFTERLDRLLAQGPLGARRIAEAMDLTRSQVDAWLLRAETARTVVADPQTRLYARADGRD